ncbi:MAG: ABC transporter ATP-binding protein [Paeniclostridium sordellii]|nr:ABC transporter ATP-binding protein [Paeniclostridium sordellii]
MKKKIIEFKDFTFKYRVQAKPTLKNINLTIYEGEKVLVVGPSGSGKSTLAHCINGLTPFYYQGTSQGSLKIMDKETKDMSIFEISKLVGTVLQDPDSQFIGLTVAEDIAFKLENDCTSQKKMKSMVEKVSKLVGIDKQLESSPYSLSGGQKQRVTLAGVTVDEVDILLFDEPLASLDPATGKSAIELIEKIKNETEKTMLIIEHRLEDVLHCDVDRIIVMNDGEIVADMNADELISSDILIKSGIREPLYITALKYAGVNVTKDMKPGHIDTIDIDKFSDKLRIWDKEVVINNTYKNSEVLLELKNISFQYEKKKPILKDVSFKINKGEMVSIVGKNGAGKSTISKLICGFYKQTSGYIFLNNREITNDSIKESAQKIGIVMQNPNQMISKTMIFDEVALGLRFRGIDESEIKDRVYETLKVCGLNEYRNWQISALRYGQKKRVTIASILVLNPEIIILDEPTAGQDFKHYNEIMEFLLKLNKKGVTIIMITHDMHLMLEYTNRAIVLADGMKLADDTAANILTNKEVIKKANLKETSVYELAVKCRISDSRNFVNKFINYDRGIRSV